MKLRARQTPASCETGKVPVLCLAGLTRNMADFDPALAQLCAERDVYCLDFRGRGGSDHAPDPQTYRVEVEGEDAIALLDQCNLKQVAIIGTSRGGLVGLWLSSHHHQRMAGLLLNDIGPDIGIDGLLRISHYLGVEPRFQNFEQAATALASQPSGCEGLSPDDWLAFAQRLFRNEGGVPKLAYDPRLAESFPSEAKLRSDAASRALWPLFMSLEDLPIALLRGENSDILLAETVTEMKKRLPSLEVTTIAGRGHVPFLDESASQKAIARWLQAVDEAMPHGLAST